MSTMIQEAMSAVAAGQLLPEDAVDALFERFEVDPEGNAVRVPLALLTGKVGKSKKAQALQGLGALAALGAVGYGGKKYLDSRKRKQLEREAAEREANMSNVDRVMARLRKMRGK